MSSSLTGVPTGIGAVDSAMRAIDQGTRVQSARATEAQAALQTQSRVAETKKADPALAKEGPLGTKVNTFA